MKKSSFQVWSASPTPFVSDRRVDIASVARLIRHHIDLGIDGVFLSGTCGEGPWMREGERRRLVDAALAATESRTKIAVQVTENSADQTLDRIREFPDADYVVVAQPHFFMNSTPENLLKYYLQILDGSPVPVVFYDRGIHSKVAVPVEILTSICEHANVHMIKDSSTDSERAGIFLACAAKKEGMCIFTGDEFQCLPYLRKGYHGMMVGGGVLTGRMLHAMAAAYSEGDEATAEALDRRAMEVLYAAYGGKNISCWLSGLKWMLVRMGIFEGIGGYLDYPLTEECKAEIDDCLEKEEEFLLTPACRLKTEATA